MLLCAKRVEMILRAARCARRAQAACDRRKEMMRSAGDVKIAAALSRDDHRTRVTRSGCRAMRRASVQRYSDESACRARAASRDMSLFTDHDDDVQKRVCALRALRQMSRVDMRVTSALFATRVTPKSAARCYAFFAILLTLICLMLLTRLSLLFSRRFTPAFIRDVTLRAPCADAITYDARRSSTREIMRCHTSMPPMPSILLITRVV